jgi:hypothetical protein
LAAGETPGTGARLAALDEAAGRGQVADDADLGMAGQGEVGLDRHAAGAVELAPVAAPAAAQRRGGHAGGPDDAAAAMR